MDEWWSEFVEPDGLVLRDRVLATVDPDKLLVALRSGRLRRVQRGIYVPRAVEYRPLAAARAAVMSSGVAEAVASHRTAGRLRAVELPLERRCEDVTVPMRRRKKNRADLRFHTRRLNRGDVELHDGVPVTSIPRTLADLACDLARLPAVWALDDALRRQLCECGDIVRVVQQWAGGSGCALAEQRLAESDGVAESILETAGRLALRDAELPLPIPQYKVYSAQGRLVARLDGAYPERRLGIEYDGKSTHSLPRALLYDRERQNALMAMGWTVLRFTWWDVVHDPGRFVAAVSNLAFAS
ncbi:MAG: DUF559 domain-containing protein [Haloechinothrix sp.]